MRIPPPARPARAIAAVVALGLAAGSAAGCGGGGDGGDGDVDIGGGGGGAALAGRTFVATAVTEDGQPRSLVDGTAIQLTFHDDGRLTANAGCNTIGAAVDVGADRLVTGDTSVTEMGCGPALHDQDEWLLGLLGDSPTYALDGDRLEISAAASVVELVDRAASEPAVPLQGTRWELDGLIDGDAVSSVPAGAGATLTFSAGDVELAVDGCNSGRGPADVESGTIVFGPLTSTRIGCAAPAAEVEAAMTAVLTGEVGYAVDAGALTLTHPSGNGLVLRSAG